MMDWNKLLCTTRIREISQGEPSFRADQDKRTEFERDYGRTVFSSPVRRLQHKAQVFPLDPLDIVRTRLTHSLEVSSVSRGMARQAASWMLTEGHINDSAQAAAIEDIAATCGLLHDIGNPPFGHAGEQAISDWFRKALANKPTFFEDFRAAENVRQLEADFLSFEGNAQTLRIVSRLQVIADPYGLNLTCGTFSAACKYIPPSDETRPPPEGIHERTKPGFFASESEIVARVREATGTGESRNPITYLVEACDDMVYCTVDIEDGIRKGIIAWAEAEEELKALAGEEARDALEKAVSYVDRASPPLIGRNRDEAMAQMFRTFGIAAIQASALELFKELYPRIMMGGYHGELTNDCKAAPLVKACRKIARERIYTSKEVLRLEVMGRSIIHGLMDIFWEGVSSRPLGGGTKSFSGKLYSLLSSNYRRIFEASLSEAKLPEKYHQLQLVTDYICGMTDTFARNLHRQLSNG